MPDARVAIDARQRPGWDGEEGDRLLALLAGGAADRRIVAWADGEAAYELRARFAGRLEVRYWTGRPEPDVAAVHAPFAAPPFEPVEAGLPLLYEPGALLHRHCPDLFPGAALERREAEVGRAVARARLLVVPSRAAAGDLGAHYAVDPRRVRVIRQRPALGAVLPVTAEPFLACPMPVTGEMDHARLIEALDILRRRHGLAPPVVCLGRVDPRVRAPLAERMRELGLERRVRFLGDTTANQRASLLAAARAVVYAPRWTAAAPAVLEARAHGRPVVAPRLPAVLEAATEGAAPTAALVDVAPGDAEALADALRRVWLDRAAPPPAVLNALIPDALPPDALAPDPAPRYAAAYDALLDPASFPHTDLPAGACDDGSG